MTSKQAVVEFARYFARSVQGGLLGLREADMVKLAEHWHYVTVEREDGNLHDWLRPFEVPDNPALSNPFADSEKIAEVEIAEDRVYHVVRLDADTFYCVDVLAGSGILVYAGSREVKDTDYVMFSSAGRVWFKMPEPGELTVRKLVAGTCNALVRVGRKV